jgi:RNA polymerase sigma-70 factor (ECF subfamily)
VSSDRSSASAEPFTDLLARARQGDSPAMGELFELQRGHLLAIARQRMPPLLRERMHPSDAVQTTLMSAHRHFEQFRGESADEFSDWLWSILGNTIRDFLRATRGRGKARRKPEIPLDEVPAETQATLCRARSICDALIEKEQRDILQRCVALLPEHYQKVLRLHVREQQTFSQIGYAFGTSANAAWMKYRRAVEAVAEIMRAYPAVDEEW